MLSRLTRSLHRLGISDLRPRADGRFSLAFHQDDRLDIHPLAPDTLLLEVELAPLPPPGPSRAAALLKAGTFMQAWSCRHPDVLCLDPTSGMFLLQRLLTEHADGPIRIDEDIERFVNAVDTCRHALRGAYPRAPTTPTGTSIR